MKPESTKKVNYKLLFYFLACVLLALPVTSSASDDDIHGAWAITQIYIQKQLAPREASFRFGGYRDVVPLGNGKYRINSYVDTENIFGGKVRQNFSVEVERLEKTRQWKISGGFIE